MTLRTEAAMRAVAVSSLAEVCSVASPDGLVKEWGRRGGGGQKPVFKAPVRSPGLGAASPEARPLLRPRRAV